MQADGGVEYQDGWKESRYTDRWSYTLKRSERVNKEKEMEVDVKHHLFFFLN